MIWSFRSSNATRPNTVSFVFRWNRCCSSRCAWSQVGPMTMHKVAPFGLRGIYIKLNWKFNCTFCPCGPLLLKHGSSWRASKTASNGPWNSVWSWRGTDFTLGPKWQKWWKTSWESCWMKEPTWDHCVDHFVWSSTVVSEWSRSLFGLWNWTNWVDFVMDRARRVDPGVGKFGEIRGGKVGTD